MFEEYVEILDERRVRHLSGKSDLSSFAAAYDAVEKNKDQMSFTKLKTANLKGITMDELIVKATRI